MRAGRLGSAAIHLALAGLAALSTLCAAEVAVDLLAGEPPSTSVWQGGGAFRLDPELIYSLRPGASRTWTTEEFSEPVEVNALGLRDDAPRERSEFERRVIVLGDSMTFGHGVANDEAYPQQVERRFREAGRAIDVINAGVKGYGIDQSFELFRLRLRALEPDVVVLAVNSNDVWDNIDRALFTIEDGRLVRLDARRNALYLVGRLDQLTPLFLQQRALYRHFTARLRRRNPFTGRPRGGRPALEAWARRKALLEIGELQRLGSEDGFALLVVTIPNRDATQEYGWLHGSLPPDTGFRDPSLDPAWQRERERRYFAVDDHFTAAGHRAMAEALYPLLAERL